ncbi:MBOAT family O-acyltransferase [Aequorivita viscosa]|uniref:D-alanyl-lipoteichoic acid acyltransferase DltB, MBOAT superfamily n=1 Tax=Aequorivita viscosa TaxID=797419 RepID=A0A1M6BY57_9FLAO|nr:MBOAT family O-acyltransferase [Aequorivita viscosa]SDW21520.1 D-alanyl-lipoteichoic acid acyltransferase DltB, MBOAT superfamily [Aequorivita viscosa]SHI53729.1 D-alanyl-lipoteichoic acid acyltransferase DltB, MBOAT superfamily [Aequorivita viscosa]
MLFNSIDFAIFFPIFFVVYWIVAKKLTLRNAFLLASSYLFYGWWDWRFLFLILFSSIVDFTIGKKIYAATNKRVRKNYLLVSLLINLGLLGYFKYTNFFIDSFINSFRFFGGEMDSFTLQIILPVGISFYTFQTLSYTIDIYRDRIKPTKDWLSFFTFVAFFPQLVAGPIERASHLLPQFFKTYNFDYKAFKSGLLLMAFGLFKKMVIADRLAIVVNEVYGNPTGHSGQDLIIATVFFAFQIYCDFSGYSDIAIGISRMLGFNLMKNFDTPYFSTSITAFWRRWHISLSTWFRDYVYIPLGGSRNGDYRTYFNLFIVFVVSGLWHGAAINFVIWGAIHGIIIVAEKALSNTALKVNRKPLIPSVLFTFITFGIVCFAWIFFRANTFADSVYIVTNLFNFNFVDWSIYNLGLPSHEFDFAVIVIILLLIFDAFHRKYNALRVINKSNFVVQSLVYTLIVYSIVIFGIYGNDSVSEFIYFQF